MKRIIILMLAALVALCAQPQTRAELSGLAVSAFYTSHLTTEQLVTLSNAVGSDLSVKIAGAGGFIVAPTGAEYSRRMVKKMEREHMEDDDSYRLALLYAISAAAEVFDYESADRFAEELRSNVAARVTDADERFGWEMLLRSLRPIYSQGNIEWTLRGSAIETSYLIDYCPDLNPALRLVMNHLNEMRFTCGFLWMDEEKLERSITEHDSLMAALYPSMPQLVERSQPFHLVARVVANPQVSFLNRSRLQRLMTDDTVDPYTAGSLYSVVGHVMLGAGMEQEAADALEQMRSRLDDVIRAAGRITQANSDRIADGMFQLEYDQQGMITTETDDDSERRRFDELTGAVEPTVTGLRCRASGIAPYLEQRTGQTVALPKSVMARTYISYVEDDPYYPYRFEALTNGAIWLFEGGEMEEATSLLRDVLDNTSDMPYQHARANRAMAYILETTGDSTFTAYEAAAVKALQRMNPRDPMEIHDASVSLMTHLANKCEYDKARTYAEMARSARTYYRDSLWSMEGDWSIAVLDAKTSADPTGEMRRLYERAMEYGITDVLFDLSYFLANEAMMADERDACMEYMETCFEIYCNDIQRYSFFANIYLSYLYNYRADRAAWYSALNAMVSDYERSHGDLTIGFIQLLATQLSNTVFTQNFEDAVYLCTLMLNKSGALFRQLPEEAKYAQAMLLYNITQPMVNLVCAYRNYWRLNADNLPDHYKKQMRERFDIDSWGEQAAQMLNTVIEQRELLNLTPPQLLDLGNLHVRLTAYCKEPREALAELDSLRTWAYGKGIGTEYENITLGNRIDVAGLAGDMKEWARLVDNEQFWQRVEQGAGNLENLSSSMAGLVRYYAGAGQPDRAIEIARKRFDLNRNFVDVQYSRLPESQRSALADNGVLSSIDINLILPQADHDPSLTTLAYDAALFYKNLLLESNNLVKRATYSSADSVWIADYERLQALRQRVNIGNFDMNDPASRRLLREMRALDDSVTTRAYASGAMQVSRHVATADVARALKAGEAAIEFVADPDGFGALILRRGDKAPRYVKLMSGDDLYDCLSPLNAPGARISPKVRRIYSGTSTRGKKLYSGLWQPLEKHLEGVSRIYYSPVGYLSMVALGAVQDSTLTPVCERFDVRLVSSTAQVASAKLPRSSEWSALALGAVNYEADPSADPNRRDWHHLEFSRAEIEHFDSICRRRGVAPRMLTGDDATEEALRAMSGSAPQLVLMSTHGFYDSAEDASRGTFYVNKGLTHDSDTLGPNYGIPALKRGGLVLAHANPVWNNEMTCPDDTDGILTAEEIAQLDLSGVNLLVLSACDTGRGETTITEGVNGLQRGLKMAGVKSMILSLWEVNDRAGREFMSEFYEHLFSGAERHEAFRRATLAMRERYPSEPANWAMFVMLD